MVRGNNKSFISKKLKKEIWKRSRLKNKANKTNDKTDIQNYKRQRNFVTSLVKKEKRDFFNNIQLSTDKKRFWKACKPYLSKKNAYGDDRIYLDKDGLLITNDKKIAEQFNSYFTDITSTLDINYWGSRNSSINEFSTHPSILKIKEHYMDDRFSAIELSGYI